MNKRGEINWRLWLSIILVFVLILIIFLFFALAKPNYSDSYDGKLKSGEIVNPVSGLSNEEAVSQFDENFVVYLLISIEAYNLHNPPLSSNKPKIGIYVSDKVFNAVISRGQIDVEEGKIDNEDIAIDTTKEEAVLMLRDKNYIVESFNSGKSSVELKADKATLFAKGYLNLYSKLTGKSITGNVIRIYTS